MPDLTELYLNNNQISNIQALSEPNGITNLLLQSNAIDDISPLSDLTRLTKLQLMDNQINDISSLTNLKRLQILYLVNNQLNVAAYCIDLPLIRANNPGITLLNDSQPLLDDGSFDVDTPGASNRLRFEANFSVPQGVAALERLYSSVMTQGQPA